MPHALEQHPAGLAALQAELKALHPREPAEAHNAITMGCRQHMGMLRNTAEPNT